MSLLEAEVQTLKSLQIGPEGGKQVSGRISVATKAVVCLIIIIVHSNAGSRPALSSEGETSRPDPV